MRVTARTKLRRSRSPADSPEIRFGTDGWRGRIARDFTFENLTRVARGVARYLVDYEDLRRGVVVAYDTRFGADRFAERVAEVLTSVGVSVALAREPSPTPALSFAVVHRGAAAGVVLTASHNPPEWLGMKLKTRSGAPASARIAQAIEHYLSEERLLPPVEPQARRIERVDLKLPYLARLRELVDLSRIAAAGLRLVIDPMHGAAAGYLRGLFVQEGIGVTEIRAECDPLFGGSQPEPTESHLRPLVEAVRREKAEAGFATDGDADRLAAVDHTGGFVDPHKIFCLLLRHLVERRPEVPGDGGVAKTFSVSKMVDRMAEHYRLPLYETPIGFKHIAELMLERDLLIGGEESGGIGIRPHLPERDGILNSLLLAEILATEQKPLADCVAALHRQFGPHHYQRVDLHLEAEQRQRALKRFSADGLGQVGDWKVVGRDQLDGIKLYLQEAGWVLVRASGTEPVLRIYAEAPDPALVRRVVSTVEHLVRTS